MAAEGRRSTSAPILEALADTTRRVWCADSFEGLPSPSHPKDRAYPHDLSKVAELAVSLDTVKANFARYDLLDDRVVFLKGWFKDTLPTAAVDHISLLRLDGDYYDSTMDGLTALYPKVSSGGFVVIDDYGNIEPCRAAVTDYRRANGIDDEIIDIDGFGVYWRRAGLAH